jgi:hypothetical protein
VSIVAVVTEHLDIHAAWKAVQFASHVPAFERHPAVAELRRVFGDAVGAEFSVEDRAHWHAYRQSMWRPQWDFTTRLLESPAFADALPMLAVPQLVEPAFDRLSPFHLAGSIAEALYRGGAYLKTKSVGDAEEFGRSLVQTMLDDRREEVDVLLADHAWHAWFADLAWDRTWIILDWGKERIRFLAATSSD